MDHAKQVERVAVGTVDHQMGSKGMQADRWADLCPFAADLGILGQKLEKLFEFIQVAQRLSAPPSRDAVSVNCVKIGTGNVPDRDPVGQRS